MCPTNPDSYGDIAELYPNVEENPAHSKVIFHETAIFRDVGATPSPLPRGPSAASTESDNSKKAADAKGGPSVPVGAWSVPDRVGTLRSWSIRHGPFTAATNAGSSTVARFLLLSDKEGEGSAACPPWKSARSCDGGR
jgi:hypothetical protein